MSEDTTTDRKTVVITGASSGFGAMSARELAHAGHIVYAGMRATTGRNAPAVADAGEFAASNGVDLRTVEMDVSDQASVDAAIATIIDEAGRIDVVVHNAGHMTLGPVEAFTPEEIAAVYDTNVLPPRRVTRAVPPHRGEQRDGLLIGVGSSSARGAPPPYLAPYFAAKAAEDSLAVSYAAELARFGIGTTIVVPGSFTTGTNHFAHAGHAADADVVAAYDTRYAGLMDQVGQRLAELSPPDAAPGGVATAIVEVVLAPPAERPFRVHIDPADDGAEVVNAVGDRVRAEFYRRVGLADLL